MNDIPSRIYDIRLLNEDLQKSQDDQILAKEVRIGQNGALEYTRIYTCDDTELKCYYNGEYHIQELPKEVFEEMKREHAHESEESGEDE